MLGLLISNMENRELEYLIKRELEELLMDMEDHRIDLVVKEAMRERYKTLFHLFRKVASDDECYKYMLKRENS